MVENHFFYEGMLRWNLGWATPNYAGAFIVTLICFARAWPTRGLLPVLGLMVEASGFFLLAKTYSRGALVALAVAMFFFCIMWGISRVRENWRWWVLRVAIVLGCMFATGLGGRMQPSNLGADASVGNRLELWEGGLVMIAAAPWTGWGAGESGRAFMNWFQDVDRAEGYTTMVNSYLDLAVRHGLWSLALVGMIVVGLLAAGWRQSRAGDDWSAAAAASLAAWAVANIFTTLWIEPWLWVVPSVAATVIVVRFLRREGRAPVEAAARSAHIAGSGTRRGSLLSVLGLAAGAALLGTAVLWGAGERLARERDYLPRPEGGMTVLAAAETETVRGDLSEAGGEVHVWADPAVLGPLPGKELRRWFEQSARTHGLTLRVHQIGGAKAERPHVGMDVVALFGRQAERLVTCDEAARVWLIHPSTAPPSSAGNGSTTVYLPEIDETGLSQAWRDWAGERGAKVVTVAGVGQDIRKVWPDIMEHGDEP